MNYLFILSEETSAEVLHCYGNRDAITPCLDALAAEGTLFEKNYTAHPVCTASRVSIVTGCYPHVHGYRSLKHYLQPEDHTFVNELKDAGYATCFAGKCDCWEEAGTKNAFTDIIPTMNYRFFDLNGLKNLWEDMQKNPPAEKLPHDYTMLHPVQPNEKMASNPDVLMTDWACERIGHYTAEKKPYFMMLSYNAIHPTYVTFEKYMKLYDPEKLAPPRGLEWLENRTELYALTRKYRELEQEEPITFKMIYATYLAMLSFLDEQVGRLVQALKDNGSYDDTMIVFCSDHGDFCGNAGLVEKWPSAMDEMLTRVPLIICHPGSPEGHRVHTPVQSIDIFPTIFDYAGLEVGHPQFGISLRQQVDGAAGDPERCAYTEGGYDTSEWHCFEGTPLFCMHLVEGAQYYPKMMQEQKDPDTVCRAIMQRDNRYKLIVRDNGQNEFYDIDNDPLEYHNLYNEPEHQALIREREKKMLSWLIHTSDVTPYEGHFLPED